MQHLILTSKKWDLHSQRVTPAYILWMQEEMYSTLESYVDDIILAGRNDFRIKEVKDALSRKFDIKDMGKLHYFLGMTVVQDEIYTRKSMDWSTSLYRKSPKEVWNARLQACWHSS